MLFDSVFQQNILMGYYGFPTKYYHWILRFPNKVGNSNFQLEKHLKLYLTIRIILNRPKICIIHQC